MTVSHLVGSGNAHKCMARAMNDLDHHTIIDDSHKLTLQRETQRVPRKTADPSSLSRSIEATTRRDATGTELNPFNHET